MSENSFRVKQLDHVELYVPDQYEAAAWYKRIFGLEILADFEFWAADGPLMISSDGGHTKLALFKGEAPGYDQPASFKRVAFNVDGPGFLSFIKRLSEHPVYDHEGELTHMLDVIDHELSFSVYFCDPYGNRYEVTTYDYAFIRDWQ